jgi:hypothetical protein
MVQLHRMAVRPLRCATILHLGQVLGAVVTAVLLSLRLPVRLSFLPEGSSVNLRWLSRRLGAVTNLLDAFGSLALGLRGAPGLVGAADPPVGRLDVAGADRQSLAGERQGGEYAGADAGLGAGDGDDVVGDAAELVDLVPALVDGLAERLAGLDDPGDPAVAGRVGVGDRVVGDVAVQVALAGLVEPLGGTQQVQRIRAGPAAERGEVVARADGDCAAERVVFLAGEAVYWSQASPERQARRAAP